MIEHDESWFEGCSFATITCPRCSQIVSYNRNGSSRPLYCSKCTHALKTRLIEHFPELFKDADKWNKLVFKETRRKIYNRKKESKQEKI